MTPDQATNNDHSTVIERLQALDDAGDTQPMQDALNSETERSLASLTYEEWLSPVRLTGNEIVVEAVAHGVPIYWWLVKADRVHRQNTPDGELRESLPGNFMTDMTRIESERGFELRPVLRAETPTGGGG